jgi:PPE-repeat protein
VAMDFAALPPEVNSGRMYSGPGSGPMLAAAVAWDELAADLYSAAVAYGSMVSALTGGPWLGPASVSMAAAAAPNVAWLSATAAHAEQTAVQAKAAGGAFEAAFAMTVPPPVIAANRALLTTLVATNIFGQNTPAIAATEAHYAEMWAQDGAAMYGYAGASAAASTLTPFTPPRPTTNPAGLAGQGAAVAQAASTSAAARAQTIMSTGPALLSAVPQALRGLASPVADASPLSSLPTVLSLVQTGLSLTQTGFLPANVGIASATLSAVGGQHGSGTSAGAASSTAATPEATQGSGLGSRTGVQGGPGPDRSAVSAGLGRSRGIGALSVPQSWAAATPAIRPVAAVLPAASLSGDEAGRSGMSPMPVTNVSGNGVSFGRAGPRYGFRPTVMARPPDLGE